MTKKTDKKMLIKKQERELELLRKELSEIEKKIEKGERQIEVIASGGILDKEIILVGKIDNIYTRRDDNKKVFTVTIECDDYFWDEYDETEIHRDRITFDVDPSKIQFKEVYDSKIGKLL